MSQNKSISRYKLLIEILLVSIRLGFTSFGGPVAHLGYFHEEYVKRKKWMDEKSYVDLVALCQFLPGPASSQVGIGIGVMRAGVVGGVVSFLGFTLPSVIALIIFALLFKEFNLANAGWIQGLKIVAVAVVAHAILGMSRQLTPDLKRKAIAIVTLVITLFWQTVFTQVSVIALSAILGYFIYKQHSETEESTSTFPITRRLGVVCLSVFIVLLLFLPLIREVFSYNWITMFDQFYRSGALVFGGGHVVLPLLQNEFVLSGMVSEEAFLAGYGATQAVPGPMFTFSAYLGAVMSGWKGGLLATFAIFLPGFLLIVGTLPFWNQLRRNNKVKGALMGVNAAVVGILISAFYQPIWKSTIFTSIDFAFAAVLFSLLAYWKLPTWIIVILGIIGGTLIL